jgi:hypothetical protein
VDPEYARVQLKHQADQLGSLSPEDLTAQILGATPQKAMTGKEGPAEGEPAKGSTTHSERLHDRAVWEKQNSGMYNL